MFRYQQTPSDTALHTSLHHLWHDGTSLALYSIGHKDNSMNYIQRSKSSEPSAKSISIFIQVNECNRVLQNAAKEVRYMLQKYRIHQNKSVLFIPIPDGNQELLLYLVNGYRVLLYSNTDNGCLPDVPAMNRFLQILRVLLHKCPPHILKHVWK